MEIAINSNKMKMKGKIAKHGANTVTLIIQMFLSESLYELCHLLRLKNSSRLFSTEYSFKGIVPDLTEFPTMNIHWTIISLRKLHISLFLISPRFQFGGIH